jgi:tetratricopeptide (TPR) repeat protein
MVGNILTLIATILAERLIYLPSALFLMIAGTLIAFIPVKPRIFLLVILLTSASFRTITSARDWNNPIALYQHSLANQPKSAQLRILLSDQYRDAGDLSAAMRMLKETCNLYPDYWWPLMFRANLDMDIGDLTDADRSVKRAIQLKADPRLIPVAERLEKLKAATRPGSAPGKN